MEIFIITSRQDEILAAEVNCFHNNTFVRREVEAMCDWLDACVLEMP